MLPALALLPFAEAFCGTYVTSTDAGDGVTNRDSQVVVAIENGQTTLTLANDFAGNLADFGLIIPVPGNTEVADVTVTDRTALDRLDGYTAPRQVRYTCDDVLWIPGDSGGWVDYGPGASSSGCGGSTQATDFEQTQVDSAAAPDAGLGSGSFGAGMEVERFTVGEYELALVEAAGAAGLSGWLTSNGYALPEGAHALVQESVSGGAKFLVAKVSNPDATSENSWLSPIQIVYHSASVSLPIRLGATASGGVQDIYVYGITTMEDGALAVANYPDVTIESDCILPDLDDDGQGEDLDSGYAWLFDWSYAASSREGRAGWTLEFNSPQGVCDPLPPGGTIENETLAALGFSSGVEAANLARIHLRGTPEEFDQDLNLYASRMNTYWQQAYIEDSPEMRGYFPICVGGMDQNASECPQPDYDVPTNVDDAADEAQGDINEQSESGICAGVSLLPVVIAGLGMLRRRGSRHQQARRGTNPPDNA